MSYSKHSLEKKYVHLSLSTMRGISQYWKVFFLTPSLFSGVCEREAGSPWSPCINPKRPFCPLWLIKFLSTNYKDKAPAQLLTLLSDVPVEVIKWSHLRGGAYFSQRWSLIGSAALVWLREVWGDQNQDCSTVDVGSTVVSSNIFYCCFLNVEYVLIFWSINFPFEITPYIFIRIIA